MFSFYQIGKKAYGCYSKQMKMPKAVQNTSAEKTRRNKWRRNF